MSSCAEDNYTVFTQTFLRVRFRLSLVKCSITCVLLSSFLAVRQLSPHELKLWLSFCGWCFLAIEKCVSCDHFCGTRIIAEVNHADCDSAGWVTIFNNTMNKNISKAAGNAAFRTRKARVVKGLENKRNKVKKPAVLSHPRHGGTAGLTLFLQTCVHMSTFVVYKEPLSTVFPYFIKAKNFHGILGEVWPTSTVSHHIKQSAAWLNTDISVQLSEGFAWFIIAERSRPVVLH